MNMSCVDVRKAHFNGVLTRKLYVPLPAELGIGKDPVARLYRCMYGTRDAER